MARPTARRLVWHCGAHSAKLLGSASCRRFLDAKRGCLLWHAELRVLDHPCQPALTCSRLPGSPALLPGHTLVSAGWHIFVRAQYLFINARGFHLLSHTYSMQP